MSTLQVANLVFESTANNRIQYIGSNTITISTAGNEDVRIDASGNVGIGTTSPAYKLDVAGVINTTDQFRSFGSGGDLRINGNFGGTIAGMGVVTNNPLMFFTNNTEKARIDASGNVGIGTTSPSAKLEANGNIKDSKGDVRDLPINNQTTAYVTVANDVGKVITTTANVTINGAIFSIGQAVSIYNNSASSITILPGTGVTMYLGGTATTGNRTLAQRGVATALEVASNTFVISGAGIT